jgi:Zn finger protein HypA/HybF involved in hydrogenase expression
MHELSIALSRIDAVCDELPRMAPRTSVRERFTSVSDRCRVVTDALAFPFDVAAADSPIAGARLEIEDTNGHELEPAAVEVIDAAADC